MKKYLINIIFLMFLSPPFSLGAQENDPSKMLGLRTVIYKAESLSDAVVWYTKAFGIKPYVNTPEYVGFNIRGFELGLMPETKVSSKGNNVLSYWGVVNIEMEYKRLIELGAKANSSIIAVGGGIKLGTVKDPFGNVLGIIYNPIFKVE